MVCILGTGSDGSLPTVVVAEQIESRAGVLSEFTAVADVNLS